MSEIDFLSRGDFSESHDGDLQDHLGFAGLHLVVTGIVPDPRGPGSLYRVEASVELPTGETDRETFDILTMHGLNLRIAEWLHPEAP